MGMHLCKYCYVDNENGWEYVGGNNVFTESGTGDVILFDSEKNVEYTLPDMALHYVGDHKWLPPQEFIDAVMEGRLLPVERLQTKGVSLAPKPERVDLGYLEGDFLTGEVPDGFVEKLEELFVLSSPDNKVKYRK